MKILILTQYPFPYGMAQTNRLIAISKGLVEAGADLKVICLKATEKHGNVKNLNPSGIFENIKFYYAGKKTERAKNIFLRSFFLLKAFLHSLLLVIQENKQKKVDVVLIGYSSLLITTLHFLLSRLLRITFIQERSEYPFLSFSKSFIGKLEQVIYLKVVCKFFDGFIVISRALGKYFRAYLRKGIKIHLLPILVEPERFNKNVVFEKKIVYCGSMQGNKDGIPILINAFNLIANKFPDINLFLIGSTKFEGFNNLNEIINRLNLNKRINFVGTVERDQLPMHLAKAKMLVLARPKSKQAEGGFPTKLGEYLSTGRPVVVTNVGELSDFLIHEKNAFIAQPNSPRSFAEQMENALSNYNKATMIGQEGKKLAYNEFNYKVQGEIFLNWLKILRT